MKPTEDEVLEALLPTVGETRLRNGKIHRWQHYSMYGFTEVCRRLPQYDSESVREALEAVVDGDRVVAHNVHGIPGTSIGPSRVYFFRCIKEWLDAHPDVKLEVTFPVEWSDAAGWH